MTILFVVSEQVSGDAPDDDYCLAVADKYGIPTELVACDPEELLAPYGKNGLTMLLDPSDTIIHRKQGTPISHLKKIFPDYL